jgi:nucleotide-binding universal stress UspA family protein
MRIIVGVDGSPSSERAVEWCAAHAKEMEAEVVAVYSIEMPVYAASGFGAVSLPVPSEPDRDELRDVMRRDWCAPLSKATVPFRVELMDGAPAPAIIALAEREAADLVVTGRRGRGGFAELLLGSTSHQLSHHLDRPLVIVP